MARTNCLATQESVREVTSLSLGSGMSALGAVLAGFFHAAGRFPGVLFSPTCLMVGGPGAGVFAYDGRCRQPGKEAKRPRGILPEDEVPPAARAAAPASIASLAVACAFHPGTSFLASARAGVSAAKEVGARGRQTLLEIVGNRGATALGEANVRKAFLAQFGAMEGGLMASADLAAPESLQVRALREGDAFRAPWAREASPSSSSLGTPHAVVAADAHGLFACVSYFDLPRGPQLDPYEVTVPLLAQPVLRGVPRVSPGMPLPAHNGLSLGVGEGGAIASAWIEAEDGVVLRLDRDATSKEIIPRRIGS